MTLNEYIEEMGELFSQLGRQPLEGRLVALLLARPGTLRLGEIAKALGVTKAALSRLVNEMLERGDLKREGIPSTREHAYQLVDDMFIAHLRTFRDVSRQMAELTNEVAADPTVTDPDAIHRLHYAAGVHAQVALEVARALTPEERMQTEDLQRHHEDNWNAILPRGHKKADN